MDFISKIRDLINSAKEYAELKLQELKLDAVEKVSSTFADVAAGIAFLLFSLLFILFISVSAALLLNKMLGSTHLGFLITGFFWLMLGLIVYAARNYMIKVPVRNWMVNKILNRQENNH